MKVSKRSKIIGLHIIASCAPSVVCASEPKSNSLTNALTQLADSYTNLTHELQKAPGAGKSPAADPLKAATEELKKIETYEGIRSFLEKYQELLVKEGTPTDFIDKAWNTYAVLRHLREKVYEARNPIPIEPLRKPNIEKKSWDQYNKIIGTNFTDLQKDDVIKAIQKMESLEELKKYFIDNQAIIFDILKYPAERGQQVWISEKLTALVLASSIRKDHC